MKSVYESEGELGRKAKVKFSGVPIPEPILEEVDRLIEGLGYWPSRAAFVREACLEKIERELMRLERLRGARREEE